MADHVYKIVEIVGSSSSSIEDATQNALKKAAKSVRHMRWFQVSEIRGTVDREHLGSWQVTLKLGFTVED